MLEMLKDYSFYDWCLMILVCSFIGFLIENTWLAFTKGFVDNRNMHLPFLLGYGLSVVACYTVMGLPADSPDIRYFVGVFLFVSCGEIILGKAVELICGFFYWDYSRLPFHITRYTSVFTSLGFAAAITFFMRSVFPSIMEVSALLDLESFHNLEAFALIVITVDFMASFAKMHKKHGLLEIWRVDLRHNDASENTGDAHTGIA
ncbi:MAG: putative ABC transporter permease [Lachnospiraceae bacterium]|nr:putative ABC transporter permease [Lachnospiraceae bacterium]